MDTAVTDWGSILNRDESSYLLGANKHPGWGIVSTFRPWLSRREHSNIYKLAFKMGIILMFSERKSYRF